MKNQGLFILMVLAIVACGHGAPYSSDISEEQYVQWPIYATDDPNDGSIFVLTIQGQDAETPKLDAGKPKLDGEVQEFPDEEPGVRFCDWEQYDDLIMNGDFEYQPVESCGWNIYNALDWGLTAISICWSANHDSCSFYLELEINDGGWTAQLYQTINPDPEREYELLFEAKTAVLPRELVVTLPNLGQPDDLGRGIAFELEPTWRFYRHRFTTTSWPESSELTFTVSGSPVGFYLDNVSVVPVSSR